MPNFTHQEVFIATLDANPENVFATILRVLRRHDDILLRKSWTMHLPSRSRHHLILSIHIPKAAGESFRARLESTFASRLLMDYGDWIGLDTPQIVARRELRKAEMQARRDELLRDYDVIHGHFIAHRAGDLEVYRRACERFSRLSARYGL